MFTATPQYCIEFSNSSTSYLSIYTCCGGVSCFYPPSRADTPPTSRHPRSRHPPDQAPPGSKHPPPESRPPPRPPKRSACWEIRATSGRYASYWNAILLLLLFISIIFEIKSFKTKFICYSLIFCWRRLPTKIDRSSELDKKKTLKNQLII